MKRFAFLAIVALVFVACSKDQKAVKNLSGTWTATEMKFTEGSLTIDMVAEGGSGSMTFNECKLKKEEWCTGTSSVTFPASLGGGTESDSFMYRVTGDGTMLETKDSDTSATITSMTIVSLDDSNLEVTWTEDGTDINFKATKN